MPSAFHLEGVRRGAVDGRLRHSCRSFKPENTPDNVDPKRAHLNLIKLDEEAVKRAILGFQQPPDKNGKVRAIRRDANVAVELVATLPQELKGADYKRKNAWAVATHKWVRECVPGRLLGSALHRDESTPHVHFWLQPITPEGRLDYSKLFNRASLTRAHRDYDRALLPLGVVPNMEEAKAALSEGYGGNWRTHKRAQAAADQQKMAEATIELSRQAAEESNEVSAKAMARLDELESRESRYEAWIASLQAELKKWRAELERWKEYANRLAGIVAELADLLPAGAPTLPKPPSGRGQSDPSPSP